MDNVTFYSSSNVSAILLAPHVVFSIIATVMVGMRLYTSRVVTKTPWNLDEQVCVAALVANHIMLICESAAVPFGLGTDMVTITTLPGGLAAFLKCILAIEVAYGTACPLSKLAVLAMYYRIFSASVIIRYCVWAISAMLIGWGIAVIANHYCVVRGILHTPILSPNPGQLLTLRTVFSCDPIAGFWNPAIARSCIDSSQFYIGITVPNIFFDVLTVVLPIHEVWRLQMGREKKLAITGVFLLGGSVVLASAARLILFCIYRPGAGETGNNISQTVIIPHAASSIETCLAIVAACLPPCAPLFRRFLGGVATTVSKGRTPANASDKSSKNLNPLVTIGKMTTRGGAGNKWSQENDLEGSFERLEDGSLQGSTDDLYREDHDKGSNRKSQFRGDARADRYAHNERGTDTVADGQKWEEGVSDIPLTDMSTRRTGSHQQAL
ncbi:hypothetical protein FZEAL_2948 [Fusarium zealandicum]|uniref:Rhodopsin domain-containing protein n=1 Tax=Fusarium zealandicum TaxID=1053134 RepID=A0A8H4UQ93_9HYPO|nr:hypothetical protein FZEAL_2948 [Fusarium zealandicum]